MHRRLHRTTASVKPQLDLYCLAFDVYFCGTSEQAPCCIDKFVPFEGVYRNEAADQFRPGSSTQSTAFQEIWHTHQFSSPSQSSFSINSAGSHYSWQPPETQREKTHRDQPLPFLKAGTAMITTEKNLRIFDRSAAQQGIQKGTERAFIPSFMKQQLCTIKKGFHFVQVSGLEHPKVCLHFCWFFKHFCRRKSCEAWVIGRLHNGAGTPRMPVLVGVTSLDHSLSLE